MSSNKITVPKIQNKKRLGERIVCVTAYDYPTARLVDEAGVDLTLVGDSLGNVVLGYETTLPVTMEEILHHLRAVRKGIKNSLLVADMPFGSFQAGVDEAVKNASLLIKAGAEAVKVEGGEAIAPVIERLSAVGIPTMAHIGMTPQSVNKFGGFRVQGRGTQAEAVESAATAIEKAGAFAVVLELIPAVVAKRITASLSIPTIGIGAGIHCDGEIQVFHDLFGLNGEETFKHTKRYAQAGQLIVEGLKQYALEVRTGSFPAEENSF